MTEQHLDQPSISSEEAQIPDTPMMTHYEAPWSPSVNSDSDSQQHRLCKTMFDAFGEGNTEKAQIYARVLLLQGTLLFRVYAYLVSSHLYSSLQASLRAVALSCCTMCFDTEHDPLRTVFCSTLSAGTVPASDSFVPFCARTSCLSYHLAICA